MVVVVEVVLLERGPCGVSGVRGWKALSLIPPPQAKTVALSTASGSEPDVRLNPISRAAIREETVCCSAFFYAFIDQMHRLCEVRKGPCRVLRHEMRAGAVERAGDCFDAVRR